MIKKETRLFDFLCHLVKLRTSVVLDINQYIETIWFANIPTHKLCHSILQQKNTYETTWIEIKRPVLPKLAEIPAGCIEWVELASLHNTDSEPQLKSSITKRLESNEAMDNEEMDIINLSDCPHIREMWSGYLESIWRPWAKTYSEIKEVQDIYSRLFHMYQQQKKLGESYEVIIGIGLLHYSPKQNVKIHRHILTAQTEIIFNPESGTITICAGSDGARLQFETDMIDPSEQPSANIQLELEQQLENIGDDIWNLDSIQQIIRSWINSLNPEAEYTNEVYPFQKEIIIDHPVARFAPALILRKKTNKGILRYLNQILANLQENEDIPPHIQAYLTIEDTSLKHKSESEIPGDNNQPTTFETETYFPLPYNNEQFRIVKEISNRQGILVQGPPGTGKSHTIANLISHFLALGKKILVTSQTSRALRVLKNKLPLQLQPLCVSILGSSQEDFGNLKQAVEAINSKYYSWNREQNEQDIKKLESKLYSHKKKAQETKTALQELREKETYKHSIIDGKYYGTAQAIADKIKNEENQYGWIQDDIDSDKSAPLTDNEFDALIHMHNKFKSKEQHNISSKRIKSSEIFTAEEFIEIVKEEQKYSKQAEQSNKNESLRNLKKILSKKAAVKRMNLLDSLKNSERTINEAKNKPFDWIKKAVYDVLSDQTLHLRNLAEHTNRYINIIQDIVERVDDCHLTKPRDIDLMKILADAKDVHQHLESGKKLGWWIFRPRIYREIKYLCRNVHLNGKLCNNIKSLKLLIEYIETHVVLEKLHELWKISDVNQYNLASGKLSFYREQSAALDLVLTIENSFIAVKKQYKDLNITFEPHWYDESDIKKLIDALESTFIVDKIREVNEIINRVIVALSTISTDPTAHSINSQLLNAINNRDWEKWGKCYNDLIGLEKEAVELKKYKALLKKLRDNAPLLAEHLCNNFHENSYQGYMGCFEKAWAWARADAWLKHFQESHDEYYLLRFQEDNDKRIRKLKADLAATKAWQTCFKTMTEEQRMHLVAWSQAIQRIGKGRSKRVEKYRREAEKNMQKCRTVIPGWIMPLYRVAETIVPQPGIFDIVIIDEASQSGPEALGILYLAKKCIVVGDAEQIAPVNIGVKLEDVDSLIEHYLYDFPLPDSFNIQNSLYSHAQIRFGSRIVLREHFRCVPEIIRFSNNICYTPLGISLIPIRPYPPQRLDPIKLRYVKEGFREGARQNVINKPEAEALVKQIILNCKDPSYSDKTMGVISLQGEYQSRYIEHLLIDLLGPEEMEKRNIVCGDAYDFQGDERDVIYLSMVAATNERIGPLAKETDKRRFNVAVSRARDQLWLYHSVTLNDLNPVDYRFKLLSYCLNPVLPEIAGLNIEDLREKASSADRKIEHPPEPFDSWFEIDVFLKIIEHGYTAIPQFEVAGKYIDIVVEGINQRLAVECDGDIWHGLEEYQSDQQRQRILERAGWRFWRVRGSTFYRDPNHALDALWQVLDEMEVKPHLAKTHVSEDENILIERKKPILDTEVPGYVTKSRLDGAIKYAQDALNNHCNLINYDNVKKIIMTILEYNPFQKSEIPNIIMKNLKIKHRGRIPITVRHRVYRIITDLIREGVIEEFLYQSRTMLRKAKR